MVRTRRLISVLLPALFFACGDESSPAAGNERGPCYPNRTCNDGLVCASDVCVDLDGGTEGAAEEGGEGEAGNRPATSGEEPECLDALLECDAQAVDVEPCVQAYVDCRAEQGYGMCGSVNEACQHLGTEPDCEQLWPMCYGSGDTTSDGGGEGESQDMPVESESGGAQCLTPAQCEAACANRVWICNNCDVPAYCPAAEPLDMETCLWECDVAFETDNGIVFDLDWCALQLGHTCDEDALVDCFYSTHC